jgi:hypothetical protein
VSDRLWGCPPPDPLHCSGGRIWHWVVFAMLTTGQRSRLIDRLLDGRSRTCPPVLDVVLAVKGDGRGPDLVLPADISQSPASECASRVLVGLVGPLLRGATFCDPMQHVDLTLAEAHFHGRRVVTRASRQPNRALVPRVRHNPAIVNGRSCDRRVRLADRPRSRCHRSAPLGPSLRRTRPHRVDHTQVGQPGIPTDSASYGAACC